MLTVNGLTAADEVLVPLQCEALSHRGVAQLLDTITDVREFTNPRLRVRGVIATMFDPRGRHAREVLDDVQTRFGLTVLEPPIPKTVRFAEAPGRGVSILEHAPSSAGAQAYRAIADAAARRPRRGDRMSGLPARSRPPARDGRRATRWARPRCSPTAAAAGHLVIECSTCGESTRMSYVDFVLANLPFSLWLPPTRAASSSTGG